MWNEFKTLGSDRMMCIAPHFGSRVVVRMPDHDRQNLIDDAVLDVLQQHWPVFGWRCTAEADVSAWAQSQADGLIFASLLKETVLRLGVEREEHRMRDLAYIADAEDGAGHFKRLADFRRVLARLHQSMSEVREAFQTSAKAELHQRGIVLLRDKKRPKEPATHLSEQATEDSTEPQRSVDFVSLHTRSLQTLQQRLDDIKEDLNEEIQVAIGAVQVNDAQIMKDQTKETIRQTKVTVALAVLAAIYLPLTLVTGIFGMNITEISDDKTAPHAWSVVVAWVCLLYTSPSPRDGLLYRMPSSA